MRGRRAAGALAPGRDAPHRDGRARRAWRRCSRCGSARRRRSGSAPRRSPVLAPFQELQHLELPAAERRGRSLLPAVAAQACAQAPGRTGHANLRALVEERQGDRAVAHERPCVAGLAGGIRPGVSRRRRGRRPGAPASWPAPGPASACAPAAAPTPPHRAPRPTPGPRRTRHARSAAPARATEHLRLAPALRLKVGALGRRSRRHHPPQPPSPLAERPAPRRRLRQRHRVRSTSPTPCPRHPDLGAKNSQQKVAARPPAASLSRPGSSCRRVLSVRYRPSAINR